MKRRRHIWWAFAAIPVVLVGWALLGEREPVYRGRTLSEWMVKRQSVRTLAEMEEADEALQRIGTRGLHSMIEWLRHGEPPSWKTKLVEMANRLPGGLVRLQAVGAHESEQRWRQADSAATMFYALGPGATNAVPELLRMLGNKREKGASGRAFLAISSLGKDALPYMLAAISDATHSNRVEVIHIVGQMRGDLRPAVPVLVGCLREANVKVVLEGSRVLASWKLEPEAVVPALSRGLTNQDGSVRIGSAQALGDFGAGARAAVTDLVMALNHADGLTRSAAMAALRNVAPELDLSGIK